MDHLEDIPVEALRRALDEVEGKKPTQRLMVAIAHKNGVSQTELAEWYGVQRRTVYNWLTRLEDEPIQQAVADRQRSGRPRKLSASQQARLEETLQEPPTEAGYYASSWTPALVQRHLAETFDVEYSRPSCRRLMKEAGLRYRKPHVSGADAGRGGRDESPDNDGKRGGQWVPE